MSTSSRVILFIAIALAACMYLVSAAPIVNNELTAQLELEAGSSPNINMFKKNQDEQVTTTTTTELPSTTTTYTKATKTKTTTTTTDAPTATPGNKKKASSSSSSGGYSGDATYYGVGLGSCGWTNSDSDMIVALNHVQMANGDNSNHNPNCGKSLTVTGPKGSVTVKIVDTCPGCSSGDVDLSPAAFARIANPAAGRVKVSWQFN